MTRRTLITGGGGFVGCHVVYAAVMAQAPGNTVVSVDLHKPPSYGNQSVELDLTDSEALTELVHTLQPTHVIHCAGVTHSDTDDGYLAGNVAPTDALLQSLAAVGSRSLERFVNVSSAAVYGPMVSSDIIVHESMALHPGSTYARSKMRQERLALEFGRKWALPVVNARLFDVAGPGQRPFMMPAAFFKRLIVEDVDPLPVKSWCSTRDYIDVRDVADALLVLADRGEPGESYNVGTGESVSVGAIVYAAIATSERERSAVPVGGSGRDDCSQADVSKLTALGWSPQVSTRQSLADCWDWIRAIVPSTKTT